MIRALTLVWRAKRRQMLIAWLAAWPTLTVVLGVLQPVTRGWPLPMRSLVSATAMVFLMNLVSIPMLTNWFAKLSGWLCIGANPEVGPDDVGASLFAVGHAAKDHAVDQIDAGVAYCVVVRPTGHCSDAGG